MKAHGIAAAAEYWDMRQPLRVLLLEYDLEDAERTLRELRRAGFLVEPRIVADRDAYGEHLRKHEFDLVLAGYRLPGWNGLEALHLLRKEGKEVPLLLVTETLGEELAVECIKQGVTDYVLKENLARLPVAVLRALGQKCVRDARAFMVEALQQSEAGFHFLVENHPLAMWVADRETLRFLQVNDAAVNRYGYTRDEFLKMRLPDIRMPEEVPVLLRALERIEWPHWQAGVWRHRCKDGRVREVEGILYSLEFAGRPAALEVAQGVTGCRAQEQHLRQERMFEAIGQLAGKIAHDFNNVIGAVLGWADLGQELAPAGSTMQGYFGKIRDQADRAAGLTRQLIAFARRQILEPRHLGLNQSVQELLSLLEKFIGKNIEVRTQLAPDLALIHADPQQVEQVMRNLCLNACDAMPGGGRLMIETRNVECGPEDCVRLALPGSGRYVLLSVVDTGTGMDAATRERIFEPFFTTKEGGRGNGLGLATVYGIVKQHRGSIHVESEPGQGSSFQIYLPAVADAAPQSGIARATLSEEPSRVGTETILVVEDHDGIREMARATLEELGYRVLTASDGAQAIDVFRQHVQEINLILLDMVLPKLDGRAVHAQVSVLRPEIPVIFSTGYSAGAWELPENADPGVPVLPKPYTSATLGRKVREVLNRVMAGAGNRLLQR